MFLNKSPLFLDKEELVAAARELGKSGRLHRPDHPHLVNRHSERLDARFVNSEQFQRVEQVRIGFARSHDTQFGAGLAVGAQVKSIGAGEFVYERQPVANDNCLVALGIVLEPGTYIDVRIASIGADKADGLVVNIDSCRCIHRLIDSLEANPQSCIARKCVTMEPVGQDFLDIGGIEHRNQMGGQRLFALMRNS